MNGKSDRFWPLPEHRPEVLLPPSPGAFGAIRKYDVHTGIDLYAPVGAKVVTIEQGTIVAIDLFTGPNTKPIPLPWWHETWAIMVEGESGTILYGEIQPNPDLVVGGNVQAGDLLGTVLKVLIERPGKTLKNSPSMLHFERYDLGARAWTGWELGEPCPMYLSDPTSLLMSLK